MFSLIIFLSTIFVIFALTTQTTIFDQNTICPSNASNCTLELYQNGIKTNSFDISSGVDVRVKQIANYNTPDIPPTNQTNSTINPNKIIILDMDDCQAYWLRPTCINIVNLQIQKEVPINLAFVPYQLTGDTAWKQPLQNWTNNYQGLVEIGMHSYDHSSQYTGWTVQQIVTDMQKGQAEFAKWEIYPKTFTPAYGWSQNVVQAGNIAGFKSIMNGMPNSFIRGWFNDTIILDNGVYCGDGTRSCVNKDYVSLKTLVDAKIAKDGYGLILFHQQDFGSVGSKNYNTLYNKWSSTLDSFKADNYTFMTSSQYRAYKLSYP
jgi:hypothetical protein